MKAATDPSDGLELRPLGAEDRDAGAALSAEVGWNQTAEDWRYLLKYGIGYGRFSTAGDLVASAMALPHGDFAWVCMVLVDAPYRRRGLATDLMGRVLDDVAAQGLVAGLDATPDGRPVYRRLGFGDAYGLARYRASRCQVPAASDRGDVAIRPLAEPDMAAVCRFDAPIFGADRGNLLRHLRERLPGSAFGAWTGDRLAGYVLARDGREAVQLGPIVATEEACAIALAARTVAAATGPVYIDILDRHTALRAWVDAAGFAFQRPFTRMYLGRGHGFDRPEHVFAAAGPELG